MEYLIAYNESLKYMVNKDTFALVLRTMATSLAYPESLKYKVGSNQLSPYYSRVRRSWAVLEPPPRIDHWGGWVRFRVCTWRVSQGPSRRCAYNEYIDLKNPHVAFADAGEGQTIRNAGSHSNCKIVWLIIEWDTDMRPSIGWWLRKYHNGGEKNLLENSIFAFLTQLDVLSWVSEKQNTWLSI